MALHWFDVGIDSLVDYVTEFHDQFGLPILLTEFAEEVTALLSQAHIES